MWWNAQDSTVSVHESYAQCMQSSTETHDHMRIQQTACAHSKIVHSAERRHFGEPRIIRNIKTCSQCCRKLRSELCLQLCRLATDAKPTQGLIAAEMKKLAQVELSALRASASGELFSILFRFHCYNSRQNG